jgi:hypothetical protein
MNMAERWMRRFSKASGIVLYYQQRNDALLKDLERTQERLHAALDREAKLRAIVMARGISKFLG